MYRTNKLLLTLLSGNFKFTFIDAFKSCYTHVVSKRLFYFILFTSKSSIEFQFQPKSRRRKKKHNLN